MENTTSATLVGYLDAHQWLLPSILAAAGLVAGAVVAVVATVWVALKYYAKNELAKELYETYKEHAEAEKKQFAEIREQFAQISRVEVTHGMLFVAHDPTPRFPLCPACYADGKIIRMVSTTVNDAHGYLYQGLLCIKCRTKALLMPNEIERLREQEHLFEAPLPIGFDARTNNPGLKSHAPSEDPSE